MRIAYYPYKSVDNKYTEISQNILRKCDCEIVDFDEIIKKNRETIKQCDAVFLNWYDSIYGNPNIFTMQRKIYINKIKFWIVKSNDLKVVFTFHNRLPHNTTDEKKARILKSYARWICKHSDYIIILSRNSKAYLKAYLTESEIEEKTRYIPHPNYIGVYSSAIQHNSYPVGEQFRILFVGQISRYKNIGLILDTAQHFRNENICFHIAGKCSDSAYKEEIAGRAQTLHNVELDLRFVEDGELEQLLRQHHIMLLPYDTQSSMNSGTVILAFSNGRTVICPEISTIQEFDMTDIYTYRYETEDEHRKHLFQCVEEAYKDWMNDRFNFESKGTRLLQAVRENNSPETLIHSYRSLLEEIQVEKQ